MQNPRQLTQHKRRHQKAKTTGKQRNAKTPTYLQQQQTQHQDEDQNIQRMCRKYIPVQFRAMDPHKNSRKQDRLIPSETTEKSDKHQMAKQNIMRRPLQQNKTGKMEWKNQDSKDEMVRSCHQTTRRSTGKTCTTRGKNKGKETERRPNNNIARSAGETPGRTGPHSRWSHRTSK